MPRLATGEVRWINGVAVARVTLRGRQRGSFPLPTCKTEDDARTRAGMLGQLAQRFRTASAIPPDRAHKTLAFVAEAPARALSERLAAVEALLGGTLEIKGAPKVPTFKELGDDWVTGKLAKRYPDQIRAKRSADDDESRLRIHVYPVLADVPINRVTLDLCEEVMRRLPEKMAVGTRRNVGQLITRLLALAVYPLRLVDAAHCRAGSCRRRRSRRRGLRCTRAKTPA